MVCFNCKCTCCICFSIASGESIAVHCFVRGYILLGMGCISFVFSSVLRFLFCFFGERTVIRWHTTVNGVKSLVLYETEF